MYLLTYLHNIGCIEIFCHVYIEVHFETFNFHPVNVHSLAQRSIAQWKVLRPAEGRRREDSEEKSGRCILQSFVVATVILEASRYRDMGHEL